MSADDAQRTDPGRSSSRARRRLLIRTAGIAGLAAAVLSNDFLLAGPLGSRLNAADSLVSELAVVGQPTSGPLRLADLACGLLVVVLAAGLILHLPHQPSTLAVGLLLAASGVASMTELAFPMPCTPSTGLACRHAVAAVSPATLVHQAHAASSAVTMTTLVLAMLGLSRLPAVRRPWRWPARASAACGVVVIGLNLAELPLLASGGHGVGVVERLLQVVSSVWLAGVSLYLLRDARR